MPSVKRHRIYSPVALALVLAVVLAPASPALGQESPAPEQTTDFAPGEEPAVVVSDAADAAEEEAWTFRFLVPVLLVLTALTLAAVLYAFGSRVRGRYRVVK